MESKDLQNIAVAKYQKGDTLTKIHRHLNGRINLATIKSWCQMIRQSGSVQLLGTHVVPQIVRALKRISKKLKSVCAENRRYQLESFQSSFCKRCQTNIKNRFMAQIL